MAGKMPSQFVNLGLIAALRLLCLTCLPLPPLANSQSISITSIKIPEHFRSSIFMAIDVVS